MYIVYTVNSKQLDLNSACYPQVKKPKSRCGSKLLKAKKVWLKHIVLLYPVNYLNSNIPFCDFSHIKSNCWYHVFIKLTTLMDKKTTIVGGHYLEHWYSYHSTNSNDIDKCRLARVL